MKVTTERRPDSQLVLNIEVDGEEVEKSLQQTYRKLVQRVKIPGFRPGKAPRAIVQNFLGKDVFLDEALDDLAPALVKRAIEEQKVETIDRPRVEVVERSPVVLKATIALKPTVELGDYKSIRLEPEKVEVTPEEIENVLEDLRRRQAPWQPADRGVAFGDLMIIDVEAMVGDRSVLSKKGANYTPVVGSSNPFPGFAEQIEKMSKGESKEFTLALPKDFPDEEVAGKECLCRVTVHEVKEKNLPPLDDDFARSLGDEYDTLKMLREKVAADLKAHAEAEARSKYEDRLIELLKDGARIEAPPVLREREIDHVIMDEARALASRGIRFENYLKAIGKTGEQVREDFKEIAEKRVTTSLLLSRLAEAEGIKVEDKEVEEEIESAAESAAGRAAEVRSQLQKEEARSSIEHSLLIRKALGALKEIASGNAAPVEAATGADAAPEEKGEVSNET